MDVAQDLLRRGVGWLGAMHRHQDCQSLVEPLHALAGPTLLTSQPAKIAVNATHRDLARGIGGGILRPFLLEFEGSFKFGPRRLPFASVAKQTPQIDAGRDEAVLVMRDGRKPLG